MRFVGTGWSSSHVYVSLLFTVRLVNPLMSIELFADERLLWFSIVLGAVLQLLNFVLNSLLIMAFDLCRTTRADVCSSVDCFLTLDA